ncbi:Anaerobic regulatory protein [compost metagenome]|uniref:CRP/FNR family transcriptional regulator, anaerobic regulatory protein n=1 Tax=Pseudomonas jinjuensis TaxID=198616 RepID=A0A1H0CXX2_9PSED|nr:fumarate/nitrate reduction transcriptional regulator Fnr [Pseudomonas jinjuensis]SDN62747.1 CRP/FNR family transcriptional regulator, anaerobic regulatory protein [Pseudomonas jinjuensis]
MSGIAPPCPPGSSTKSRVRCQDCSLSRLCLPDSLQDDEIAQLDGIIRRSRPLQRAEYLFRAGEPVEHIYALRSGSLKTYLLDQDGGEQITAFHLPGELVGLDALSAKVFPSYALAMETSLVCSIPLPQLEELSGSIPNLRKQLLHALSREIHTEQEHLSFTRGNSEQRLAAFLLNLSARYSRRGLSAVNFILPMGRSEIGNYLGLTTETVSRLFSRYRQLGVIDSAGREVRILDWNGLCQLAGSNA